MTDLKTLAKKVNELEERLKRIEGRIASPADTYDKVLMNALYQKARDLVVKHNKASVIFLQRKLMIDFERAKRLLEELQKNGVIEETLGVEQWKILVKKR
jgi:DNA segregation ATPase FtsK/SpoIIIE-like protein